LGGVSDRWWLWANTAGYRRHRELRSLLPELPSRELQEQFTGSAGDRTLTEAWHAYRLFRETFNQHSGGTVGRHTRVLDFGCGWGRIIRFFTKDIAPDHLWGVDVNEIVISVCLETNPWAKFELADVLPPSPLAAASFDLVYGYSVFSHLSEKAQDAWLSEFSRIMRPGGILMLTTWPRTFIEHCAWLRKSEGAKKLPASHQVSAGAFTDTAGALAAYDSGEFTFSYRKPDDPEHFGEACVPESYARANWTDRFEIIEYIDDRKRCPQNLIVARRRR